MVRQLIGRDAQVGIVRAWLGDRSALPGTLLLEGVPGIGKSSLVGVARDLAAADGYRVLAATPAEAEAELAYAGLGDLAAGLPDGTLAALPDPQREAIDVALLRRPSGSSSPDPLGVAVAFLGAVRRLAADAPVLIAIDDWQWLDLATAAVLRFAARRLTREPVAMLLARRTGGDPVRTAWPADLPASRSLALDALTLGATHALVHERLDLVLSRPVLRRLHERSGGNPLWALELGRGLRDGRITLASDDPLPAGLAGLMGDRLRTFPAATRTLLGALAAMPRPSVGRASEATADADPGGALSPAVAQEIVAVDGDRAAFSHPMLASVALGSLSADERRALHRRLAATSTDPVERVRHDALGAEGPDEAVAAGLEAVAMSTGRRAGATEAAELMALARAATPPDDVAAVRRRTLLEADHRLDAGDPGTAATLLDGLLAAAEPGSERARILARLARVHHFRADVAGGVALLRAALAEPDADDALRSGVEEGLAWGLLLMRDDLDGAWRHARSAAKAAARSGDRTAEAEALAAVALTEAVHGRPRTDALERALALEAAGAVAHLRALRHPSFAAAYLDTCADTFDAALARYGRLLDHAEERGDESGAATLRAHRAMVLAQQGHLDEATAEAHASADLAFQAGLGPTQASALGRLALIHAWRGDAAAATDAATRSLRLAGGETFTADAPAGALARGGEHAIWASGELALAADDVAGAIAFLEPLARALIAAGVREPGELRFLPSLVDALVRAGRGEEAAEAAALLEAEAARVDRSGARAAALLARGTVEAGAGGSGPEAAATTLDAAVDAARAAPDPQILGRTLLALGRAQRRLGRKRAARATLEEAAGILAAIGAAGWAGAARAELARIGGRAPAGDRLTPTEARVAALVAQGRTNKEIAAELVVTPKAVEAVIARCFARLGVHSRAELAARIVSGKA